MVALASIAVGAAVPMASAQPVASAAASSPAPGPVVHIHTDAVTGVKYLNGGVGDDEQRALKAAASAYPLDIVFARKDGAFQVVDKVTVRDRSRIVLTVSQAGPFLMAKLPPGKYAVEASAEGKLQKRTIEVEKGAHRVVTWRWDDAPS